MDVTFYYGMRLRPFSIGCQPEDGILGLFPQERLDAYNKEHDTDYWDIIVYNHPLTDAETNQYDLDYLYKI